MRFVLFLLITTNAQASFIPYPSTPIHNQEELVVMGKGLKARGTEQTLALVCENQECESLRYAIFDENGGHFFGSKIPRTNEVEIQREAPRLNGARGALVMLGATVGMIFLAPLTVVSVAVFLGVDALMVISSNNSPENPFEKVDVVGQIQKLARAKKSKAVKEGKVFLSQDGWNWSVSPKKASPQRYCETIASIMKVPAINETGEINIPVAKNSFVGDYESYMRNCLFSL